MATGPRRLRETASPLVTPAASSIGPYDALGRYNPDAHLQQAAAAYAKWLHAHPGQTHPAQAAPASAGAPPAADAAPADPAAPDFRDAQFGTDVNALIHQIATQRAQLQAQGQQDQQDYDLTASRMNTARDKDLLDANHSMNAQGLFESGQLTKARGDLENDYRARQEDARTAFDRRAAARQAAIDQIGQVTADDSNPLGYTAAGDAAGGLSDIVNTAIQRRQDANQGLDAPLTPHSVGTSPVGATAATTPGTLQPAGAGLTATASGPQRTTSGGSAHTFDSIGGLTASSSGPQRTTGLRRPRMFDSRR